MSIFFEGKQNELKIHFLIRIKELKLSFATIQYTKLISVLDKNNESKRWLAISKNKMILK